MIRAISNRCQGGLGVALLLALGRLHAEEFAIQVGDTIEPGRLGTGAGNLEAGAFHDVYTLPATAGQIVFLEEVDLAQALRGWLRWEIKSPSGQTLWTRLFTLKGVGRMELTETGAYSIRCFTTSNDPMRAGDYSFRVRAVPPDQIFGVQIGSTVSKDVPAPGAGHIEVPGAQDFYTFAGLAQQSVFFDEISSSNAFENSLRWECLTPNGQRLFSSLFRPRLVGTKTLPEAGTYTLRFFVGDADPTHFGDFAFQMRTVSSDSTFAIEIGSTISDGVPAPGAGRLESPGAKDIYTFAGTAGQNVFFEELSVAQSFAGSLRWECKTPGGQPLFSALFTPRGIGRKTLPETGAYTIQFFAGDNDPAHIGEYSFRTSALQADSTYPISIGDTVASGLSAPGTGSIEEGGSQDKYSFTGTAGQEVVLERISVADSLAGALRWEFKGPGDRVLFSELFRPPGINRATLPDTGTYWLRLFASGSDPRNVGTYSFRIFCEVYARPDSVVTPPDMPLAIPLGKLKCNDTHGALDVLEVDLPGATSAKGGALTMTSAAIIYTPKAAFTGRDSFTYRIRGRFGGEDTAVVSVWVSEGANQHPAVVSVFRKGGSTIKVCLLGLPRQRYAVEASDDLHSWAQVDSMTADETGSMTFQYVPGLGSMRFYRFRRL